MEGTATLRIVGDIMLGGSVAEKVSRCGPFFPFEKLSAEMQPSDMFFGNLECTLCENDKPPRPKKILLHSDVSVIKGLKKSGINIVSLANNHSFDYGCEAFTESRRALENSGIKCVGGGKNIKEASQFTLIKVNELRFGFLAYCSEDTTCEQFASDSSYGVASVDPERIYGDIRKAKHETDFVVVSLHWGKEFRDYPTPENISIARSLVENGASVVVGSHTHVFQGYEKYKNGLILYDLGSFIFGDILINTPAFQYNYFLKKRRVKEGIMVHCVFNENGLADYEFIPTLINSDFQATLPDGNERKKITKRFEKQSKRINSEHYGLSYPKVYLLKTKLKNKIKNFLRSIKASFTYTRS